MKTRKYVKNVNKKTRNCRGGKAFASSSHVKLSYHDKDIVCEICRSNNYTENTGAFGKSKVRSGIGQLFLGDAADVLDTTSVIIYTCNTCGLCRIIRNKDPILIKSKEV
jgi:ssDNA-binding Zn-finger/Zn-ribbon topoisomerase 1